MLFQNIYFNTPYHYKYLKQAELILIQIKTKKTIIYRSILHLDLMLLEFLSLKHTVQVEEQNSSKYQPEFL